MRPLEPAMAVLPSKAVPHELLCEVAHELGDNDVAGTNNFL